MTNSPADEALGPLCEAFADYPVMRYVLGPDGDYRDRLRTLLGFFLAWMSSRRPRVSWRSSPEGYSRRKRLR
ncbi:MAG: hypothetical protein H0T68_12340 [Gemmatimonadales bacterium]|nr:hypothetical protein [Gemmatimonadales bacterium]